MPHRLLPLAGSQVGNYGYVDAPVGLDARFNMPYDCELSKDRSYLYVSDYGNNVIRRITLNGSYPVETFCPAFETGLIHVNPSTGNLWFMSHEGTEDFHTARHHITRVTPSGNVSFMYTFVDEDYFDCLPDPNERYIRVKGSLTYIPPDNTRYFYYRWWIVDLRTGSIREHSADGNYGGRWTGQMWSRHHPDTYFWLRGYQYPSDCGASLGRAEEFGAPFTYDVTYHKSMQKVVSGQDALPNETFVGLSEGYVRQGEFRADPANPYISPLVDTPWLTLPRMPAVALARDYTSDTYYFPMHGGENVSGLGDNIPYNTVSIAVPNNQLSVVNYN